MGEFLPPDLPTLLPLIILPGSAILHSAFCIIYILQQPGAFILLCVFIWRLGVRGRFQPLLDSVRRAFPHPASTLFDAKPEGAF